MNTNQDDPIRPAGKRRCPYLDLAAIAMVAVVLIVTAGSVHQTFEEDPGHHITTANEPISEQLPNRGVLSVHPHSRVHRIGDRVYVEAGVAELNMPLELSSPGVLETLSALATVQPGGHLRVEIGATTISYDVYAGVVLLRGRHDPPGMMLRRLQKGQSFTMSIKAMAHVAAERRNPMGGQNDG